jgi:hypothetical protein
MDNGIPGCVLASNDVITSFLAPESGSGEGQLLICQSLCRPPKPAAQRLLGIGTTANLRRDRPLGKKPWEVYRPRGVAHQAQEAVGVEDKVCLGGGAVADEGVHAADLEVAGDDLQVVVQALQLRLPQFHLYVLRDQVNRHLILHPGRHDISTSECHQSDFQHNSV